MPPLLHFQNWHTCSLANGHALPWLTTKLSLEGISSGGQSSPHICAVDSPASSHLSALLLPPLSRLYLPSPSTDVCPVGNSSLSQVNKRSPFPMAFITIFPLFALPVSLLYLPFIPLATSKPASLACTFIQTSAPHWTPPLGCLPSLPNSVCLKLTSAPSVPSCLHSRASPFLFRSQVKIMIQPTCLVAQHVHNSPDPGDSATVRIFYDTQPVAPSLLP